MIKLLEEKLEAAKDLENYTKQILSLSPKTDSQKISAMIDNRQKYKEKFHLIDERIEKIKLVENFSKDSMFIKNLKNEIRESIKQTIDMDNKIRKNINNELKSTKEKYNHTEKTLKLNLKA